MVPAADTGDRGGGAGRRRRQRKGRRHLYIEQRRVGFSSLRPHLSASTPMPIRYAFISLHIRCLRKIQTGTHVSIRSCAPSCRREERDIQVCGVVVVRHLYASRSLL